MEHEKYISRLMLFLFCVSVILILNILSIVTGDANEFWSDLHLLMASYSDYA
jgi:hypothetical protein